MARSTFTVSELAKDAGIDIDETLITLWDGGINYVGRASSVIRRRDANRARRIVGLLTRRELASQGTWQSLFGLDDDEFANLLGTLRIPDLRQRRLSQKAISRLQAEATLQGLLSVGDAEATTDQSAKVESSSSSPVVVPPPLSWRSIGQERDVKYLETSDVRAIHEELVKESWNQEDPIEPPGVRDENLLESAMTRPRTSMGEDRKYPTVEMSAAALLHSLIHNHPFHNGNKRTGLVSMLAFLDYNRRLVTCEEAELFKIVLQISQHSIVPTSYDNLPDREVLHIAEWIQHNSRRIELGDRVIPFRRLHALLTTLGCTCDNPKRSYIPINRTVRRKRRFRMDHTEVLSSRAPYRDEGRDVDKVVVARIRKELELDEIHGIDSAAFYDNAPAVAGDFIVKYRKTLHRLARL